MFLGNVPVVTLILELEATKAREIDSVVNRSTVKASARRHNQLVYSFVVVWEAKYVLFLVTLFTSKSSLETPGTKLRMAT